MAKTAAQPKTMESNHKVASVLSTGLFAILCVLIAFPLLAGFFASFQEGREVVMKGMSLNLDFSKMHLDNYKYLFSGNEDSRKRSEERTQSRSIRRFAFMSLFSISACTL